MKQNSATKKVAIPNQIELPSGEDQVEFAKSLEALRCTYLLEALLETLKQLDMDRLDQELAMYVDPRRRAELAGQGLRAEIVYALPYVLESRPQLLGYYRLLLGHSGKAFYEKGTGVEFFASMESKGTLSTEQSSALPMLCEGLIRQAALLVDGIGVRKITKELMDDLTLLTLGTQLRGGANTQRGVKAMAEVRSVVREIVASAVAKETPKVLSLKNAAGRTVIITLSGDPDLTIQEDMGKGFFRKTVSMEVKGGADRRNIYNRMGEAEKSHNKAKQSGFTEFWTIVNVPNSKYDIKKARDASPTTNEFYDLSLLVSRQGPEYEDFRRRIITYTGIGDANEL